MRALCLCLAATALTACGVSGFRPLYRELGGAGAEAKLSLIEFSTIPGRVGQRLRSELLFMAYGGGTSQPAKFRLNVSAHESNNVSLVLRDGASSAHLFEIEARFQLIDLASKKVLLEGVSRSRTTLERTLNPLSNIRASEEAQPRAAKAVATDLKARVACFLATTPS